MYMYVYAKSCTMRRRTSSKLSPFSLLFFFSYVKQIDVLNRRNEIRLSNSTLNLSTLIASRLQAIYFFRSLLLLEAKKYSLFRQILYSNNSKTEID